MYRPKSGIIDSVGVLGMASRLTRLAEILRRDSELIYREFNGPVKYRFYPVLFILYQRPPVAVTELAAEMSFAHPYIIQVLKEMNKAQLVTSSIDKNDSRRRLISLTPKGKALAEKTLPYSRCFEKVLVNLFRSPNDLLCVLNSIDGKLQSESFFDRVKTEIVKAKIGGGK